ncbi:dicarboxylate:amino acid:cation symporter DAACS family protein [Thalassobacillus devorans]|uniref:Dicarboxylate:amino acid:cation symporter DAACS family protein n=1 Tax=Thalassobacillus devorans TaxID=279813 RepID=A0ABQ1NUJ0_9BACI|nr:dicarboxylate/amino acid:cation symporter [Thalassobacillus devorans]NIK28685.1 Na+/H+-dicarboxylate symporter [Thalassobacillus devorans]GGC84331.1 dicarboxylate:amino acid:cation symporter DAACS family protein [Thalassobacillus devorans]
MKFLKGNLIGQIFAAFVLAIAFGTLFSNHTHLVQPLGDLFLRLIKFIIIPLILSTLIVGVANSGNVKNLGKLGGKSILYYLSTTFLAVSIGLFFAFVIKPGANLDVSVDSGETVKPGETEGIVDTFLNIVPTNPFQSLVEGSVLQVIFFALFIGIAVTSLGNKGKPVYDFFESFAQVMYKITAMVMKVAPIGVFGLIAPVVGDHGLSILAPLLKIILAMAIASILHAIIVYSIAVKAFANMNPIKFFKGISEAALVGFSTCSSAGTLPVTMKNTQENLGVSRTTSSFVLPLGATINMDGAAIYQGIAVMFVAQFYGVNLSFMELLIVVITATLASIGSAGVPGAGLVMLTMVLASVNLPLEGIALVAAIDRILDMFRTAVNVVGDASACVVVDSKKEEDEKTVATAS